MARLLGNSIGTPNPFIDGGQAVTITADYQKLIRPVPAFSFWAPIVVSGVVGKYVPLFPFGLINTGTTTTIDLVTAAEADWFDPSDSKVNPWWLAANDGAQKATYWGADDSATPTFHGAVHGTGSTAGAIYSESQKVNSVSTAAITLAVAFTADPSDSNVDVLLPGGLDNNTILWEHVVIVPEAVDFEALKDQGAEWDAVLSARINCTVRYSDLPYEMKTLIGYGVVPTYGTNLVKIYRD